MSMMVRSATMVVPMRSLSGSLDVQTVGIFEMAVGMMVVFVVVSVMLFVVKAIECI
jgi:hypothetical protein